MMRAAVVSTPGGCLRAAQALSWRHGVGFGVNAGELAVEVGKLKAGRASRSTVGRSTVRVRARVAEELDIQGNTIAEDYYSILGLVRVIGPSSPPAPALQCSAMLVKEKLLRHVNPSRIPFLANCRIIRVP